MIHKRRYVCFIITSMLSKSIVIGSVIHNSRYVCFIVAGMLSNSMVFTIEHMKRRRCPSPLFLSNATNIRVVTKSYGGKKRSYYYYFWSLRKLLHGIIEHMQVERARGCWRCCVWSKGKQHLQHCSSR